MTDSSLRYENEQLKRKLLQTQEERDRAMTNCHELWKRLQSLISLAASTTASYTLSSSGLPTSPSDSYDSRSKSTSPNSSSAASLTDSLLSNNRITTSSNNNNNNNNNINNSNHHTPLNLKSVNVNEGVASKNNVMIKDVTQTNHVIKGMSHNIIKDVTQNVIIKAESKDVTKDINNNHPLIAEVAKVTTLGDIEEIAPGQFKCRYCDKTFDRIFSVHRHERVHTGYKPCICKACGRGFSEKRNLRHHIIRFHSDGSGRELLKRNRNKSAAAAAAAAAAVAAQQQQQQSHHHQQQQQANAKQQIKQLSAAAAFSNGTTQINNNSNNQNSSIGSLTSNSFNGAHLNRSMSASSNGSNHHNSNSNSNNNNNQHHHQQQQQQHQNLIDYSINSGLLSNNSHLTSTTSSQITATISRMQNNIKNEPIDTSGLNVLGAAAAVITVSSSSSRRRKNKPSKKINY